jgi:hypothetical protein
VRQIAFCIFLIVRNSWSWSAGDPLFFFDPELQDWHLDVARGLITNFLTLKFTPTSLRPGTNWALAPTLINPAEFAKCAERRNPARVLCTFSISLSNRRSLSSSINDHLVPFPYSLGLSLSAGLAIIDSASEHMQAYVLIAQGLTPTLINLDEPSNLKGGSPVDMLLSLQYTRYTLTFCSIDEMKKGCYFSFPFTKA